MLEYLVQLAERIHLKKDPSLSSLCHRAKNLYNLANYYIRQEHFHVVDMLTYYDLDFMLRKQQAYQELPAQTAQQVLRQVAGDWRSFFAACRAYQQDPSKFNGTPRPPKYKPSGGESVTFFTNQQCRIVNGLLYFPKKANLTHVRTRIQQFQQVRIIPRGIFYIIEIVYNVTPTNFRLEQLRALGIDIGVNNLLTAVNNIHQPPVVIKGGVAKSTNQFYNKYLARLRSVATRTNGTFNTHRIEQLHATRANIISDFFHKASRAIVNFCIQHNIGTIAIGHNPYWKQNCNLGHAAKQNFVSLPLYKLIQQIQYKAALAGIITIVVPESYTSRCSFLDGEIIGRHQQYKGRRIRRGLFQSQDGKIINADVNAAYNILRKAIPEAFVDGIEGVGLHPLLLSLA